MVAMETTERAWTGLEVPYDKVDRDLLNASMKVTIRNGKTASFRSSS